MKLKVYGVEADKDDPLLFEVPDNGEVVSAFYHPVTGILTLVVIEKIPEESKSKEEPPEEKDKEAGGAHKEEGGKEEGASNVK